MRLKHAAHGWFPSACSSKPALLIRILREVVSCRDEGQGDWSQSIMRNDDTTAAVAGFRLDRTRLSRPIAYFHLFALFFFFVRANFYRGPLNIVCIALSRTCLAGECLLVSIMVSIRYLFLSLHLIRRGALRHEPALLLLFKV